MYIFDAHCDYLWIKALGGCTQLKKDKAQNVNYKKSIFAVFEGSIPDETLINDEIQVFQQETPIEKAYIAFEGLSWVHSLWNLEDIIKHNPVYVGPMWNNKNEFGGSAYDDMPLTIFGQCFLKELDDRGIFIDLAHAGKEMFYSSLDNFKNVIYSHGNVYDICPHPRNLRKEQIKKLIEQNSFLGLTLYEGFVGSKSIEKLFSHIEYVLDMGGKKILGIGSDIDGCKNLVGKTDDVGVFEEIIEEFYKRNYPKELIKDILHRNLEKCIKKNVKNLKCSQKSR